MFRDRTPASPCSPGRRADWHAAQPSPTSASTKRASAHMLGYPGHPNPPLPNWQGMSTQPKMKHGSELCHRKRQLIIELRIKFFWPCKSPQTGAKLGKPRASATRRYWATMMHLMAPCMPMAIMHGHVQMPVASTHVVSEMFDMRIMKTALRWCPRGTSASRHW